MNQPPPRNPFCRRGINQLCALLALGGFASAVANVHADTVIYSQTFTYSDGTLLTTLPGWYDWGTGNVPTISGGKVLVGANPDMLFNMTDIFSYGNTQAKIEFDLQSYQQNDVFLGPGSASGLDVNYNEAMGFEHGSGLLYHYNQSGFNYANTVPVANPLGPDHWVFNISKSGNQYTWDATYGGNALLPEGPNTFTLNDSRGMNTLEWYGLGNSGATMDNLVITAVSEVPEPSSWLLMAMGGLWAVARWTRKA